MINITDKAQCCGCAACMNACPVDCITMRYDLEGCEYPSIDANRCIECGRCEKVCPVAHPFDEVRTEQRAFLVQNADKGILEESTSGGAFSAVANEVLNQGGVVFGHGYVRDDSCKQFPKVACFSITSPSELSLFRNSKYVQSEIGHAYREAMSELKSGRPVLFSGVPCQIEGFKRFLGKDYDNLILADVVCRAVPCRSVFQSYVSWLEQKFGKEVKAIRFRDKRKYGYRYSNICAFSDSASMPFYTAGVESDPYLRAFFSGVCNRPSCYSCKFKKRYRASDLTLWDCFDVKRLSSQFNNNGGVTRVLVHTGKGFDALHRAKERAKIEEVNVEKAVEGVRELTCATPLNQHREQFVEDIVLSEKTAAWEKWFPDTPIIKLERYGRRLCERLGIYDQVKGIARAVLGAHS